MDDGIVFVKSTSESKHDGISSYLQLFGWYFLWLKANSWKRQSTLQLQPSLDKWDHWMCSVKHTATTVILFFIQAILRENKEIWSDACLR